MTYTNLPPTLYEMFGSLDDRVRKLETGPNLAYTTGADALQQAQGAQNGSIQAYSVATQAQIQATTALFAANGAASQATVAQATASFAQSLAYAAQATANSASAQATVAQNTANGKNKVYYSLVTPGSTANTAGDIWFQYSGSGLVIAQYVGLGGTSWQQQTITQAVIGNLDAGKVTTGILNAIEITAGSGSQVFRVTPTGYLSAQGAYIKGNITADSGTFNGSIQASNGLFGSQGTGNYWSITSTGITGVGTATITGGLIQGSSIQVPQTSPLFQVFSNGSIQSTAGTIGGWTIGSTTLSATSGTKTTTIDSSSATLSLSDSSTGFLSSGAVTISASGATTYYQASGMYINNKLAVDTMNELGSVASNPRIYAPSNVSIRIVPNAGASSGSYPVSVEGDFSVVYETRLPYAYNNTVSNTYNLWISSTGQIRRTTASSQRFKENIVPLSTISDLDVRKLLDIPVRAFKYKEGELGESDERYQKMLPGFIAEEVEAVYPIAVDHENGQAQNWNERMVIPGMLALIQDLESRMTKLEGNNG